MTAVYEGFTRGQKLCVAGCAIFAVFVSLAFAAWIMGDTLRGMQFNQQDQEAVNRLSGAATDPAHQSILRAQAIDAVANLKQLANRQSTIMVAFAGAFALCAVGFALFLLGADGAFRLQTEHGRSGPKLWLASTAPGIACFVLAVILVGTAAMHRSNVNLVAVNFPKQTGGVPENSAPRSPAGADTASNVEAQKAELAAEQRNAERDAQNRAAEKVAAANLAAKQAAADKLIADELAVAKAAAEKAAIVKLAAEKAAAGKRAAEKIAADKRAAEVTAAEKSTTDKQAAQKAAAAKWAAERAAAAKLSAQKAADAKLAVSKAFVAGLEADRVNAAQLAADRQAADKLAADKSRAERAIADRLAPERARTEKAATERGDVASLTAERIAAAGTPSEVYRRAIALRNDGETSQAVGLLRYASSTGHGPSSRLLASIYREGAPHVRANFRQAERYQALADAQGDR